MARWAGIGSAILTVAAMLAYPGGTIRDPSTRGYSFFHNFLSDLGATVAWGGQPNGLGAWLFLAAFAILALALAGFAAGFMRLCSSSSSARNMARAAGVAVLLSCVGLVGAALAPADRSFSLHVRFGVLAQMAAPVATLLFALATAGDARFGPGAAVAWASLTVVPVVLIAVRYWGPGVATDSGLVFHVTVQKLAAVAYVALCVYLTYAADRVARRSRTKED